MRGFKRWSAAQADHRRWRRPNRLSGSAAITKSLAGLRPKWPHPGRMPLAAAIIASESAAATFDDGAVRACRCAADQPAGRSAGPRGIQGRLNGHQKAGACVARCAFEGAQFNVGAAWFDQRQLHLSAACSARQFRRLKMGTARRGRCDFHRCHFRLRNPCQILPVAAANPCSRCKRDAFNRYSNGPNRAVIGVDGCASAHLFDKPPHQSESMPLAFGFRLKAGAVVADAHGCEIAVGAAHRH